MPKPDTKSPLLKRRDFLATVAATGLAVSVSSQGETADPPAISRRSRDDINVVVIGFGSQGSFLADSCLSQRASEGMERREAIAHVRFKAVCDIRLRQRGVYGQKMLKRYGHTVNIYEDYREMLAQERDLDAVIVASPDWMHAEHTNACLKAGLHVYCEKAMSHSLAQARSMVLTARETGKLLQIGFQRRSNPRYRNAIDAILRQHQLLGRVTNVATQWNRATSDLFASQPKFNLDQSTLEKWGYASMMELLNWRWYRKYGNGPCMDLGSHQIDLLSWIYGCQPSSVMAIGGNDYYRERECYDNVTAHYEFKTPEGTARASCQVLTTNRFGGYNETVRGVDGTIVISENAARGNLVQAMNHIIGMGKNWLTLAQQGLITCPPLRLNRALIHNEYDGRRVDVTDLPIDYQLGVMLDKQSHVPHLENFFDAIRLGVPLNCPAEQAYASTVSALKANEAVATGRRLDFTPEDFTV